MNPLLDRLLPYPFERLRLLNAGCHPPAALPAIALSIGEPRHPAPRFVLDRLTAALDGLSLYPVTRGMDVLRESVSNWLTWRFQLQDCPPDPERHVLPVNGSREALFSFVQSMLHPGSGEAIVMPNPFYQIYEGAALLAGAEPVYLPCDASHNFIPDYDAVPESLWKRTALVFICSPGNPSGSVTSLETLQHLIELSDRYGFILCSDECYSEIYPREDLPPPGLLQAAAAMGRHDYRRLMVFHSLSKRSNLPGLRSGFVAGDAHLIERFLLYRTYHGSAMSVPTQLASVAAWNDEAHVRENRQAYRSKFDATLARLRPHADVNAPDASFYLWMKTPGSDTAFARGLWEQQHVQVLPGSYLSRDVNGHNPGEGYVRIALVPDLDTCLEATDRIIAYFHSIRT
ncbi:MAG: succinyldiaminopimelate transaminase [Pseudomonadales bacterium]|nr:succinyldiaminopimelate transaminase [Pseudomonadales bacterium]